MSSELGTKINRLRLEKKMTLEELSQKIGAQKSYVWSLENRRIEKPSAEKLAKIADALGVTPDFLLGEADAPDDNDKAKVLFRGYTKLLPEDQEIIDKMVEFLGNKPK